MIDWFLSYIEQWGKWAYMRRYNRALRRKEKESLSVGTMVNLIDGESGCAQRLHGPDGEGIWIISNYDPRIDKYTLLRPDGSNRTALTTLVNIHVVSHICDFKGDGRS